MNTAEPLLMSQHERENIISQAVKNYGGKLMSFVRPKVKNTEDAEDILQEVWYQFSNVTNLGEIVNVGSWLYKVSQNKIIDRYRKKTTENLEDFTYEDDDGSLVIRDILLADESSSPELKIFQDEVWKELFKALDDMPEKQRYVFVENELNARTLSEIATELDENLKTIISRKQYAVKFLRTRLQKLYDDLING